MSTRYCQGLTKRVATNPATEIKSGRADSNRRSLDPQSSALTKLGHVPLSSRTPKS